MSLDEIYDEISFERRKLIKELFGDNKSYLPRAKVIKYHKILEMVDTNKLIDFSIYMDSFRTQYINMEVAMTKAINAYKKALILNSIKKGVKALKSIKEVEKFCKEAFREEDLFSGHKGSPYIDGVVICVDENGNLRNKFIVNKNGVFARLDSSDEKRVWEYLFAHQEKIGVVEYKQVEIKNAIEDKKDDLVEASKDTMAFKMCEKLAKEKRIGNANKS
ncbi:hypothetical protein CYJ41_07910 [Campylobacter ureolyticus]|uniref:Uncharacterized protein n=1 Tax=Campylobacter ureolyticus TaxID=827 RepID=A0A2I1N8G9_9BACT|nr:hypothetical protein [Campylobacter ureolyticus]PKZ28675.1 hypothetical protein CYJ41_07910 [Campylobacter ureolyticus]